MALNIGNDCCCSLMRRPKAGRLGLGLPAGDPTARFWRETGDPVGITGDHTASVKTRIISNIAIWGVWGLAMAMA